MCNFSLFLHAHELICTSIDIKTLNDVTTLTPELLSKAMVSKSGLNGKYILTYVYTYVRT